MKRRYPLVNGFPDGWEERDHCAVAVTWHEGESPQVFCGDNDCTGPCGLPALIIPWPPSPTDSDRYSKASGSQVACGPLMQSKRVQWTGDRVLVPEEHRADFEKRWYL